MWNSKPRGDARRSAASQGAAAFDARAPPRPKPPPKPKPPPEPLSPPPRSPLQLKSTLSCLYRARFSAASRACRPRTMCLDSSPTPGYANQNAPASPLLVCRRRSRPALVQAEMAASSWGRSVTLPPRSASVKWGACACMSASVTYSDVRCSRARRANQSPGDGGCDAALAPTAATAWLMAATAASQSLPRTTPTSLPLEDSCSRRTAPAWASLRRSRSTVDRFWTTE
mmetsp:Transcript_15899/g.53579  ORF Transcript_15899/g.53579 Transcript_15899/m.53579 type:complete len:228 (+) Transcript_15899:94-777(+)